mgnify:CR=1 FL=1
MGTKNYRNYIEKVKELNVVLQQLSSYNYCDFISSDELSEINAMLNFFKEVNELINEIKKDYSSKTNVGLDDVVIYFMKDYYLLYSNQNKDNVYCYDLEGKVLWKSMENVKFLYQDRRDFVISVANESIGEFESSGFIWCFMTYNDDKIRRIPNTTIEDISNYKFINDNLIEIKFNNGDKVNIFDKNLGQIIISDVDRVERPIQSCGDFNEHNSFVVSKRISFDDKDIDCQFYLSNYGYIISDIVDSEREIYSITTRIRHYKTKYNEVLEKKFEKIRETYQEKGRQLVKKN